MTSFYPAVNGRATSQLGISRLLFQINNDQTAIQDLQTQLSTGRRISKLSADPAAGIRALTAQRQLEFKAQVDDNLQSADTILSATEATLAQAQSIMHELHGVAVLAASTTLSDEERDAYASQIEAGLAKLTELANAKFRDQFLFAGSDVLDTPLRYIGDTVQFTGNENDLRTITDFASTVAANVSAEEAFGVRSEKIVSTIDLNPAVALDTPLSQLNRGDGVGLGAISISDGIDLQEIDLANAYDLNDVLEAINATQISGRELNATLTANGIAIDYTDAAGGLLRIDEVGSGVTAAGLGIKNTDGTGLSPVTGTDLNPILTGQTRLSQLFDGASINIGDTFQIFQGADTHIVASNGAETVEDLLNNIRQSGAQVTANIDPTGRFLSVQSTESGTSLSIGEHGSDLATVLGLRTFDTTTSVRDLNFGQGIFLNDEGDDLILTRTDGTEISVNLTGVQNVGDVLNRINNHVDNFSPTLRITASLTTDGNGIVLSSAAGVDPIRVRNVGGSQAAFGLGLIAQGAPDAAGELIGTDSVIGGADVSGVEVEGVFNSLIRMREAIDGDRPEEMQRIAAALDDDIQRMSLARGLVGTRQQAIIQTRSLGEEQQLQLRQIESDELDADLAQVISELAAREAALQASLQLMGQTTRLTLFDYL